MLAAFSYSRLAWALLTLGAALLFTIALYFQYVQGLAPCVMCVYQRAALAGVILAASIGWLAPNQRWLSNGALLGWLGSALMGTKLALEHIDYQFNPSPFVKCSTVAEFPAWLALDAWWPALFYPSGDCADASWVWLGLTMPQWLLGIFMVLAAGALFFIGVRLQARIFTNHSKNAY